MKYLLTDEAERGKALAYLMKLMKLEKEVEIKEVRPPRSLKQNSYLHLLLAYLGMEIGEELEVVKDIYKMVNKNIYFRSHEVFEVKFKTARSSADLNVEEMTASIDTFRKWSEEKGYPLPSATDQGWLREIENRMEQEKYLYRSDS